MATEDDATIISPMHALVKQWKHDYEQMKARVDQWRTWAAFVYLGNEALHYADEVIQQRLGNLHDEQIVSLQRQLQEAQQDRDAYRAAWKAETMNAQLLEAQQARDAEMLQRLSLQSALSAATAQIAHLDDDKP